MLERLSWKRLALELVLCCIPALILGAFFGYLAWFLLAAVVGLLIWHYANLLRLSWWLWVDRSMTPPPGRGSWETLLLITSTTELKIRDLFLCGILISWMDFPACDGVIPSIAAISFTFIPSI